MNCPACGAPVEAGAQFCAECGAPLENSETEATIVNQTWPVDAESVDTPVDKPVTTPEAADDGGDLPVAAETPDAGQPPSPTTSPETDTPLGEPPPSSGEDEPELHDPADTATVSVEAPPEEIASGDIGGSNRRIRLIVGGVALLLIIILCCCSVIVGAIFGIMTSELGQEVLRELGAIPVHWPAA